MIDFKHLMTEAQRMCKAHPDCNGCPLNAADDCLFNLSTAPETIMLRVVMWVDEHPRRTMLDALMDSPTTNASIAPDGSVRLCPHHLDPAYGGLCTDGKGCAALCRKCWSREVD